MPRPTHGGDVLDLDNPDDRLALQFALRVHRLCRSPPATPPDGPEPGPA